MEKRGKNKKFGNLRDKALELMKSGDPDIGKMGEEEIRQLVHELQVHQVELEIQNDELLNAQEELESTRKKYLELFESAPVGYCTLNDDGEILEVNNTFELMTGFSKTEIFVRKYLSRFVNDDHRKLYFYYFRSLALSNDTEKCEVKIVKKDKTELYARLQGTRCGPENAPEFRVTISDISENIRSERERLLNEEKFSKVFFENPSLMLISRLSDGIIMEMNNTFLRKTGFSRDELINKTPEEAGFYSSEEERNRILNELGLPGSFSNVKTKIKTKFHKTLEILLSGQTFKIGEEDYLLGMGLDLTELIRAEKQLSVQEEEHHFITDNIPLMLAVIDRNNIIVDVNEKFCSVFNLEKTKCRGLNISKISNCEKLFSSMYDSEERATYERKLNINGTDKYFLVIQLPFGRSGNREEVKKLFIIRDVTDERIAGLKLSLNTKALDSAGTGVIITDKDGVIEYANEAFTTITGYDRKEVKGKKPDLLKSGKHAKEFYAEMWDTVLRGEVWHGNITNKRKDGLLYDEELTITPVRDDDNKISHFIAIFQDITERTLAEESVKKYNEELQKLNEEKDKFFSVIAHDLKSPISTFLGFSEVLAYNREKITDDELEKYSKQLFDSAKSVYTLLENLLEWSKLRLRGSELDRHSFVLSDVIRDSLILFKAAAENKGIELTAEIDNNLEVFADKNMIHTVLRNLINNAVKFTSKGGSVKVKTYKRKDNFGNVSVTDSGVGMSEKDIQSILSSDKPFSRTGTNNEKGTGLGLMVSLEFIKLNGGELMIESVPGKGSSFSFTLPASK